MLQTFGKYHTGLLDIVFVNDNAYVLFDQYEY